MRWLVVVGIVLASAGILTFVAVRYPAQTVQTLFWWAFPKAPKGSDDDAYIP